jgi:hypothetical protein
MPILPSKFTAKAPVKTHLIPRGTLSAVPRENEIVFQYSSLTVDNWLSWHSITYGLGSWVVRWQGSSEWSHVDIVTKYGDLIGARADNITVGSKTYDKGVQVRPNNYLDFAHALRIKLVTPRADEFYDWVNVQIGKPYDHLAIWGFAFNRNWRIPNSWICDELLLSGTEQIDFFGRLLDIPTYRINPGGSLLAYSAGPSYEVLEQF